MTREEQREWAYLKEERLGILCADHRPTPEQVAIAEAEANQWLKEQRGELL